MRAANRACYGRRVEDPVETAEIVEEPMDVSSELPMEQFVEELERMMIAGHSILAIRRWAMLGYRVDEQMLSRFQDMIRRSWAIESQTMGQIRARRDALRVAYFEVFQRAMDQNKFLPAIKALDSIAKMDGLMSPDVNLTQINVGGPQTDKPVSITNGVRDRIHKLGETMRLRAEQRAIQNSKLIEVKESK